MERAVVPLVLVATFCVSAAGAHELPTFPRITVLAVRPDPFRPLSWNYSVRVLDPAGRAAVSNADVRITGFERRRGSDARLDLFWLAPTPMPGVYQGTVQFPEGGTWEVTITVKGQFVGETHVEAVVGSPGPVQSPLDRPDLDVDWILVRHLLLEWGHLAGFGLWLGATVIALLGPEPNLRAVVAVTWIALVLAATTGLYKLQVGTPFTNGLTLGRLDIPRIFFGREYVTTLVVKRVLTAAAIAVTAALTWRAWWRPDARKTSRRLLAANLTLAVLIAGCVTVLNLLHAIVLHFS
jgi:hypothetical protein